MIDLGIKVVEVNLPFEMILASYIAIVLKILIIVILIKALKNRII